MTVALCIPTRGKPEMLRIAVEAARKGARLPDTKIVVGFDADDQTKFDTGETDSVAPREDSVGAKYNRLFREVEADIYVQGVDDLIMSDGWDEALAAATTFPDGIGAIYYGRPMGGAPGGFALTKTFLEIIKGFPEQFPFWWYDTWIHEIANMTGRITWAQIDVQHLNGRGQTRGCRDIAFWQTFFDELRPSRIVTAANMIHEMREPEAKKALLYYQLGSIAKALHQSGSNLRDPMEARLIEQQQGHDAPADDRYKRIKSKAEAWLAGRL